MEMMFLNGKIWLQFWLLLIEKLKFTMGRKQFFKTASSSYKLFQQILILQAQILKSEDTHATR